MKYCGIVTDESYWECLRELKETNQSLYRLYFFNGFKDLEYAINNEGRQEKRIK